MATTDVKFSDLTYHYYYIRSQLNGLVLDIEHVDYNPGAQIHTWTKKDDSSADSQLWYFVGTSDQFTICSKLNGLAMDVKGSGGSGTPVITYPTHGRTNQLWSLQDNGADAFIASCLGNDLVIDIKGANKEKGAAAQVYPKKNYDNDNQQFQFIPA